MKKITTLFLLIFTTTLFAQKKASVEKSVYNIEATILGFWINNETKLTNQIALRSEVGFKGYISGVGTFSTIQSNVDNAYLLIPQISVEPKWYFNLNKRNKKGRDISNNSANYWSFKALYLPNGFMISNKKNAFINSQLDLTVNWGFKRNFNKHWNYECGIGFGIDALHKVDEDTLVGSLTLRIGYKL